MPGGLVEEEHPALGASPADRSGRAPARAHGIMPSRNRYSRPWNGRHFLSSRSGTVLGRQMTT